jgi:UDP-glucose 4-epimerase
MKKNFILITGASGFIGSNLVKNLIKNDESNLILVDDFSNSSFKELRFLLRNHKSLLFFDLDLKNFDNLNTLSKYNIELIIHLASTTNVAECIKDSLECYNNNLLSIVNLLKFSKIKGIKKFIFSSTAAVYGNTTISKISETVKLNPISPYGHSKAMCEKIIEDFKKNNKYFNYIILRFFNIIGKRYRQKKKNYTNLFDLIDYNLQNKIIIKVYGKDLKTSDGTPVRDYLHVKNLSLIIIRIIRNFSKIKNNIYNIGSGEGYTVKQVIDCFAKEKKIKKKRICFMLKREGDPNKSISNISKICKKIKYPSNIIKKKDYLQKMIQDYLNNT